MPETPRYVVLAELRARPECAGELAAFMARHAAASRAEPGCLTFDVCRDPADPTVFVLYEMYTDAAAYTAHRATEHYARFLREAPALIEPQGERLLLSRRVLACP